MGTSLSWLVPISWLPWFKLGTKAANMIWATWVLKLNQNWWFSKPVPVSWLLGSNWAPWDSGALIYATLIFALLTLSRGMERNRKLFIGALSTHTLSYHIVKRECSYILNSIHLLEMSGWEWLGGHKEIRKTEKEEWQKNGQGEGAFFTCLPITCFYFLDLVLMLSKISNDLSWWTRVGKHLQTQTLVTVYWKRNRKEWMDQKGFKICFVEWSRLISKDIWEICIHLDQLLNMWQCIVLVF